MTVPKPIGSLLACLLLVGLSACNVLGATDPQEPTAVPTATPNIQATIEAAEQAAVRHARVEQIIATMQAAQTPTHTPSPTSIPDTQALVEEAVQATIVAQATPTPTATLVPTVTPVPNPTTTPTPLPGPAATATPVPTATAIPTSTPAPTSTPQVTATATPVPRPKLTHPRLTVSPPVAVANQSVVLEGDGFSVHSDPGGTGEDGRHRITGEGTSFISLAGNILREPYVTYPIDLDSGGHWIAQVLLPVDGTTLTNGQLLVSAKDDSGIVATVSLSVPERILTLEPDTGQRGSEVIVKGTGFPAKNSFPISSYPVNLDYSGTRLNRVTPDAEGKFEVSFTVPLKALIPSQNTVTATISEFNANAVATHNVPPAVITFTPESASPGSPITVIGYNFPAFSQLSNLTLGLAIVLPATSANTDRLGRFTAVFVVPQYEPGVQVIQATVAGVWANETFVVSSAGVDPIE